MLKLINYIIMPFSINANGESDKGLELRFIIKLVEIILTILFHKQLPTLLLGKLRSLIILFILQKTLCLKLNFRLKI